MFDEDVSRFRCSRRDSGLAREGSESRSRGGGDVWDAPDVARERDLKPSLEKRLRVSSTGAGWGTSPGWLGGVRTSSEWVVVRRNVNSGAEGKIESERTSWMVGSGCLSFFLRMPRRVIVDETLMMLRRAFGGCGVQNRRRGRWV